MNQVACPRCGNPTNQLRPVDGAIIAKLRESGSAEVFPSQVCGNCLAQLSSAGSGSVLLAREKAREHRKMMLWNSGVNLMKRARRYMNNKMYSDAAVAYEKYIKVLEVVFDSKQGDLTPEHFKDSARTQELTVVASVYWDLLRIYDTNSKYAERQNGAAKKLAQFLRFTPIYPDIIRKAEYFQRTAKNPSAIKTFLKLASESKGRCFIATAAFQYHSPEVQILTEFRDSHLMKSQWGKVFVEAYYLLSPAFAQILDKYSFLRPPVQRGLRLIIGLLPPTRLSASRQKS